MPPGKDIELQKVERGDEVEEAGQRAATDAEAAGQDQAEKASGDGEGGNGTDASAPFSKTPTMAKMRWKKLKGGLSQVMSLACIVTAMKLELKRSVQVVERHRQEDKQRWRRTSKELLYLTYLSIATIVLLLVLAFMNSADLQKKHYIAWAVALVFTAIAVPVPLHMIHMHLIHYRHRMQRNYIRILWMVPIFACDSWLALYSKGESKLYFSTIRECYEAYTVFCFYQVLREFLGPDHRSRLRTMEVIRQKLGREDVHHMAYCFNFMMPKWKLDGTFLTHCTWSIMQYAIVRIFFAVLCLWAMHTPTGEECEWDYCVANNVSSTVFDGHDDHLDCPNMNGEGEWHWNTVNPYKVIIVNLSQTWAMYCLILFYHETRDYLQPLRPLTKFVSIKGVVFVTFYQLIGGGRQACVISVLDELGIITSYCLLGWSVEDVVEGLQNFLICCEMSVAAILFYYAFPDTDFAKDGELEHHLEDVKYKDFKQGLKEMVPIVHRTETLINRVRQCFRPDEEYTEMPDSHPSKSWEFVMKSLKKPQVAALARQDAAAEEAGAASATAAENRA